MRLRNVKGSQEKILENPYTIQTDGTNGEDYKSLWNKNIFKNDNPIHIEIGMGKGQFIMGLAAEIILVLKNIRAFLSVHLIRGNH